MQLYLLIYEIEEWIDLFKELMEKEITKKVLFFAFFILILYLMKSILNLLLLTFLFTYLISSLIDFIYKPISKVLTVKKGVLLGAIYILMVFVIAIVIFRYIPIIVDQSVIIFDQFADLKLAPGNISIEKYITPFLSKIDIGTYTKTGFATIFQVASSLGALGANILISLILSLFFILEKNTILNFLKKFKYSKISGFYELVKSYGTNFLNSFGKVIRAQVIIATVNSLVSVIFLAILGFPYLMALGFMVFILGLIPVAGVLISLVPLALIAFKVGGLMKVIYILILVAGIHSLESYILNPRLMSEQTKIPVFFTFVILIISEHFMGVWGLLLGIPMFIFILDLLGIDLMDKSMVKPGKVECKEIEKSGGDEVVEK